MNIYYRPYDLHSLGRHVRGARANPQSAVLTPLSNTTSGKTDPFALMGDPYAMRDVPANTLTTFASRKHIHHDKYLPNLSLALDVVKSDLKAVGKSAEKLEKYADWRFNKKLLHDEKRLAHHAAKRERRLRQYSATRSPYYYDKYRRSAKGVLKHDARILQTHNDLRSIHRLTEGGKRVKEHILPLAYDAKATVAGTPTITKNPLIFFEADAPIPKIIQDSELLEKVYRFPRAHSMARYKGAILNDVTYALEGRHKVSNERKWFVHKGSKFPAGPAYIEYDSSNGQHPNLSDFSYMRNKPIIIDNDSFDLLPYEEYSNQEDRLGRIGHAMLKEASKYTERVNNGKRGVLPLSPDPLKVFNQAKWKKPYDDARDATIINARKYKQTVLENRPQGERDRALKSYHQAARALSNLEQKLGLPIDPESKDMFANALTTQETIEFLRDAKTEQFVRSYNKIRDDLISTARLVRESQAKLDATSANDITQFENNQKNHATLLQKYTTLVGEYKAISKTLDIPLEPDLENNFLTAKTSYELAQPVDVRNAEVQADPQDLPKANVDNSTSISNPVQTQTKTKRRKKRHHKKYRSEFRPRYRGERPRYRDERPYWRPPEQSYYPRFRTYEDDRYRSRGPQNWNRHVFDDSYFGHDDY